MRIGTNDTTHHDQNADSLDPVNQLTQSMLPIRESGTFIKAKI